MNTPRMNRKKLRWPSATFGAAAFVLTLTACASSDPGTEVVSTTTASESDHQGHDDHATQATEQASPTPRLVMTYDGGLVVIDATTLETAADLSLGGFNRISPAGDGRHVAIATDGGWAVLDAGTWAEAHGDHAHYFTADPHLHGVIVEAEVPGHVVANDGLATLFDDGSGHITVVETHEWADMAERGHAHPVRELTLDAAHHGVAVTSTDGTMLVTRGNEDGRTGAMLLNSADAPVTISDDCSGVHGETAFDSSQEEAIVVLGCEDGALIFHGDHVHKLASPDDFGRIGNVFSVDGSDVVLGDYKNDPDAGIGLEQIAIIDTATDDITVVSPFDSRADVRYTWRGLARGDDGEFLVLGTDGALQVINPATGASMHTIDVIEAWDVPEEWQAPHPVLTVLEGMAFVTDPANGTIHAVDYVDGEVWKSASLDIAMNEIVGVTGAA